MNKIPVKKLIEYRRLSERRKKTFVKNLNKPKEKSPNGGGGDYWVRSISAISASFKSNDNAIVTERLERLIDDYNSPSSSKTKTMRKRNIDILKQYVDFDYSKWSPSKDLKFVSTSKHNSLLNLNGLPIYVNPHHVFTWKDEPNKEIQNIGAIWFVTWLDEFKPGDLGIYSEAVYRYLKANFSHEYKIVPKYCLTIDVSLLKSISYHDVHSGEVPSLIENTLIGMKENSR
jgi:hypothetical protein